MTNILQSLTDDGRGVFLAASKPSSETNDMWRLLTISRNNYGDFINLRKKIYGKNPFHLRKFIDPTLLKKAPSLHKNIRYHEISISCSDDELLQA
jgi:hypothetical protein